MFKYAYDLNGCSTAKIQTLPIATGTAIELGEVVKFTPGTGVVSAGGATFASPVIGVAA